MDVQSPFRWDDDRTDDETDDGLISMILRHADDHDDDQIALADVESGLSWRYRDLTAAVTRCARKLCAIGANSGAARLALVSAHTARVVLLQMAAVDVGCTVACINAGLNPEEIWQQMEAVECTHCVIESQFAYKIDEFRRRNATKGANRCRITKTLEEFFDESKKELNRRSTHYAIGDLSLQDTVNGKNGTHDSGQSANDAKCKSPVFIFFSYGMCQNLSSSAKTTVSTQSVVARPICVRPAALCTNLRRLCAPQLWRNGPRGQPSESDGTFADLLTVNVHNLFGTLCVYATLSQRRSGYVLAKFTTKSFAATVFRERISTAYITVAMSHTVAAMSAGELNDVAPLRRLIVGGVRFDGGEPTRQCAVKLPGVDIRRAYITTEIGGICTLSPPNCSAHNSVGVPLPGLVLRVVRLTDESQRCEAWEPGALLMRVNTQSIPPIYVFRDNDTTERLYVKSSDGATFMKTGDVAYYDSNGYIFVSDKISDLIRWNLITVIPSSIENAVQLHDGIADCAIVQCDDQSVGSTAAISLFIVRNVNRQSTVTKSEISANEVRRLVAAIPEAHTIANCNYNIHFVTEIARSSSGRILRRRLRQFIERERVNLFNGTAMSASASSALVHRTNSIALSNGNGAKKISRNLSMASLSSVTTTGRRTATSESTSRFRPHTSARRHVKTMSIN